jgi:5'-3' exonuclease
VIKPIAYIDADIVMHRALAFTEPNFCGRPVNNWRGAVENFHGIKDKWLREMGPIDGYQLVFSKGGNFRKGLYPDYKANRKDIIPHPAMKDMKALLLELPDAIHDENIEADDLIGIKATETPNTIMVSADKDFLTLPGTLCIPSSHKRTQPDWHVISEAQADHNWLVQAMTGDTIDNYKGIPGIGPAKARIILTRLEPVEVMWPKVVAAFATKGLDLDYAILQARLARILRHGEYNFETKEVTLWTPQTTPRVLNPTPDTSA